MNSTNKRTNTDFNTGSQLLIPYFESATTLFSLLCQDLQIMDFRHVYISYRMDSCWGIVSNSQSLEFSSIILHGIP